MSITDLSGREFGRLRVIEFSGIKNKHYFWNCKCACGNITSVDGGKLNSGHTQSCGCLGTERRTKAVTKHGQASRSGISIEYSAWKTMRQRCEDKTRKDYKNYGGRGISVCKRWSEFQNFYADMGPKPSGYSIERKDNNLGYSPENCAWETTSRQARNKRTSKVVEFQGKQRNFADLCDEFRANYHATWQRVFRLGWSVEKALSQPIRASK